MVKQRVMEAKKMGYQSCVVPYANQKQLADIKDMKLYAVKNIMEAVSLIGSE